ncbi:SAM-dependent methyltransferase [Desulfonema limicola]|uniref:SAM-dependent methyltransferase n=1 Tax=Desulfonema limicola TaxID=45656 RepID=A0A975B6J2_9BACT|nr:N-6 DNA methylase [Desulfonema limicola]QTA79744.1 SAM-dependent methyltransferase [Desulfonema limicola]
MILEKEYSEKFSLAHRKKFAQFFTPEPIAEIMINWLLKNDNVSTLLEPAFGLGIFSRLVLDNKKDIQIKGFEIDPAIFHIAKQNFSKFSNINLLLEDYLFNDWNNKYDAVACNPPYFKFHDYENKKALEEIKSRLKINLSGFTNVYTLFLLKSIYQLNENGRAAYIIPSEFLNSDYGKYIKDYLLKSNTLRHIIIFNFEKKVFDDALTTSAIILLAKDKKEKKVYFSTINNLSKINEISALIKNNRSNICNQNIFNKELLNPDIKWRKYYKEQQSQEFKNLITFNSVAKAVRGIATGANDYFTFNISKANKYSINEEFLLPCITKSKDVIKPFFTPECYEILKKENANIYLFNAKKDVTNPDVLYYIDIGLKKGIHQKYLTSKRNPWYILEKRPPAPIWAGVFNRNGIKFVRNEAGISNLTTFHCIYPVDNLFCGVEIDLLFAYLLTEIANDIFNDNRREYGDGLKKFEPNDLNNAMMLDLTILDNQTKNAILTLYKKYRKSILDNNENNTPVKNINEILMNIFRK